MNSFRSVERAIAFEIERQAVALDGGEVLTQDTRGWDDNRGVTYVMRSKEESHDYRYFPEPDLPPLRVDAELARGRSGPACPSCRRPGGPATSTASACRPTTPGVIVGQPDLVAGVRGDPRRRPGTAGQGSRQLRDRRLRPGRQRDRRVADARRPGRPCSSAAELADLLRRSKPASCRARTPAKCFADPRRDRPRRRRRSSPRGASARSATARALGAAVDAVIAANPAAVADHHAGKPALGFLVGQVMKATRGQANAELAGTLLRERLDAADAERLVTPASVAPGRARAGPDRVRLHRARAVRTPASGPCRHRTRTSPATRPGAAASATTRRPSASVAMAILQRQVQLGSGPRPDRDRPRSSSACCSARRRRSAARPRGPSASRSARCSIAVQRSITTDRPPALAIAAASQLTTPSWSHRQPAPIATASRAWGRHSSERRKTSTMSNGPGRLDRLGQRPEGRLAEDVALVRVDRDAVVAVQDEVAEDRERRPGRVRTTRRRPRSGGPGQDHRDPRVVEQRGPGRGPPARSSMRRRTARRPRSAAGRSAAVVVAGGAQARSGRGPAATRGRAGRSAASSVGSSTSSRPGQALEDPAEDDVELGLGQRAPRGSSGSRRRTTGTGSGGGRGRARRPGRRRPGRDWPPRTGGPAPGPGGSAMPSISMSSRTQRSNIGAGVSKRRSSSIAVGTRSWSARRAARAAGSRNSAYHELAAPLTDASWPAFRSRIAVPTSSSSVSRSPASATERQLAQQVARRAGAAAPGRGPGCRPRTRARRRPPGPDPGGRRD